jgi:hypothetical protein
MTCKTTLQFHCPKTGAPIKLEAPSAKRDLVDHWADTLRGLCPHCGERHSFTFRDGYVNGVMANLGMGGVGSGLAQFTAR